MIKKVLLGILAFIAQNLCAYDFEKDGIYYQITSSQNKEVSVTYKEKGIATDTYAGNITIPETVEYSEIEYKVTSIGLTAFQNCNELTSVSIPNTVSVIGIMAFNNCQNLAQITIPNSVTKISEAAFKGCKSIDNIIIPENITEIERDLFYECDRLSNITLPEGLKYIKNIAFYGCKNLANIKLPYDLLSIGGHAFEKCSLLKSINIPSGVKRIEDFTFSGCEELEEITLPDDYNYLGQGAFSNCKKLKNFSFPQNISEIPATVFFYCKSIESITIPQTVKVIKERAFYGCDNLKTINIPEKIETIEDEVFQGCKIENIAIPNSCSKIGKGVFQNCGELKTCKLSENIERIEEKTFYYCEKLEEIQIPSKVSFIGELAFASCKAISSLTIPKDVNTIENSAFILCSNLKNVISEIANPFAITDDVFKYIPNDAILMVPQGSKESYQALSGWSSHFKEIREIIDHYNLTIKSSEHGEIKYGGYSIKNNSQTIEVKPETKIILEIIPDANYQIKTLTEDGSDVTSNISNKQYIINSISKNTIIEAVFEPTPPPLYKLTYKVDGEVYKTYELEEGESITPEPAPTKEGYTFSGWSEIPETMPAHDVTVTGTFAKNEIGGSCGANLKWTYSQDNKTITISGIGDMNNFSNSTPRPWLDYLSGIETVVIEEGVSSIGDDAFNNCNHLTSVNISNSVTSIGFGSFSYCSALSSITIPSSVVSIGSSAFRGCSALSSITIPNNVTTIGTFTFAYCSNLTSITIPNTVTKILDGAFEYCSKLPSVTIPNSVTYIGTHAFEGCILLSSISIPNSVTEIDSWAFLDCTNLISISIGSGVTNLHTKSFAQCPNLADVYCYAENVPNTENNVFVDSNIENTTLHVLNASIDKYKNSSPWNKFKEIVKIDMPKHTLTYKVDGEVYKSYQIEEGEILTPEPAPTKEGYTFSGWSEIPQTMPAKDVTVTGTFTINKYKLTYKVDGEVYKEYELDYGATITPEPAPTKEGYEFSGWSEIPSTMPANNVEITGSFKQIEYNIEDTKYEISGEGTVTIKGGDQKGNVEISGTVVINGQTYKVTAIAENAFTGNTQITSVTIPEGITSIGSNAFSGCVSLLVINIGKSITSIGNKAFANVGTSSSARTRGESAFIVNCYAESVPQTATDAFENSPIATGTLLVNDNIVDAYKTTTPWSQFGKIQGFQEAAGINAISIDNPNAHIYDMQGNRIDNLQKGVNIIRLEDGKTKKVIVK